MKSIEELIKGGMSVEDIIDEAKRVEKEIEKDTFKQDLVKARTNAAEALNYYFFAMLDRKMPDEARKQEPDYRNAVRDSLKEFEHVEKLATALLNPLTKDRTIAKDRSFTGTMSDVKINKEALSKMLDL